MRGRVILARAVHTLVDNELRPGAEASRTDAERAAAQTRLIQARQGVALAQITLARVLGMNPEQFAQKALHRFRQLLELGEIIETEGQPAGRRGSTTWLDAIARS